MGLLQNKVGLITGAGGGIGRGVARRFAREGATVVIAEIDPKTGTAVAAECKELGAESLFVKTDVTDKARLNSAIQPPRERFGGPHILGHNAFVPTPTVRLEQKTDAMLESTLKSVIWATWWRNNAAQPRPIKRGVCV